MLTVYTGYTAKCPKKGDSSWYRCRCAEGGKLRSLVNIYLNDEDIRHLKKDSTTVKDADTIMIVPSVAEGQ